MSVAHHQNATWHGPPVAQQPDWPDPAALRATVGRLANVRPLVSPEECDALRDRLAEVTRGEAFLLQGGDCAEALDDAPTGSVHRTLEVLHQMAVVLAYSTAAPVVKVGRLAGQFAKPRSQPVETRGNVTLPSYRGDAVNGAAFTASARTPDPTRLERVYESSAATLELMRQFRDSDGADLGRAHARNLAHLVRSGQGRRYARLADGMDAALAFLHSCGGSTSAPRTTEVFTSHEALLLDYEAPLARTDPRTGLRYALSGHMVWVGERTRQLDGAHVEFAAGVANPIGLKVGPGIAAGDLLALVDRLDPDRVPGRLTLISRMGGDLIRERLPALVEKVRAEGAKVVWVCDPMHGNTRTAPTGHKTRHFDAILDEITGFFEAHRAAGTHPGGLHVELTGENVTECVGGDDGVRLDELPLRYGSACDPRLNRDQSVALAFRLAEWLDAHPAIPPTKTAPVVPVPC